MIYYKSIFKSWEPYICKSTCDTWFIMLGVCVPQQTCSVCGNREQTCFLCGAEHVGTCSHPFGRAAAAVADSVSLSKFLTRHWVLSMLSAFRWVVLHWKAMDVTPSCYHRHTHRGVKHCDRFSTDFKLLLTFYLSGSRSRNAEGVCWVCARRTDWMN